MWGQRSGPWLRACGEKLARRKGLVLTATALACFGLGLWLRDFSERTAAAPPLRQLIGNLQKRDTFLHDAWEVVWLQAPRWITDRCGILEPRPAVMVRCKAPAQLAALGSAAAPALPFLLKALNDPDATVQLAVLESLADLRGVASSTIPTLLEFYSDTAQGLSPQLRGQVAETVVAIDPESPMVLEALVRSIQGHPNVEFRARVIQVLGRLKASPRLLGVLSEWLSDPEPVIRNAAIQAAGEIGPGAAGLVPQLVSSFEALELKRASGEQAGSTGTADVPPMTPTLARRARLPGPTNVYGATVFVRSFAPVAAAPAAGLRTRYGLASNPAEPFGSEYSIVVALGKMGPAAQAALPLLNRLLGGRPRASWRPAVFSRWQIDGDTAAACAALRPALAETASPSDRINVIQLLGQMSPEAAVEVLSCLRHAESTVRFAAARALGNWGPLVASAVPDLERLLHDDPKIAIRMAAAEALRRIAPERTWNVQLPSTTELFRLNPNRP